MTSHPREPLAIASSLLLVISGAAAVVYQVLWIKQLSLILGVDVHAVAAGVSAFFAGLAAGSWVFGQVADHSHRPLRLYAWLEAGVALLGVASTLALAAAAPLFVRLESSVGALAWALPLLLVALPAGPMGGTLPAMLRAVSSADTEAWRDSGRLYAANTAGAIAGALLPSFALIPAFGVRGAALAAAAGNLAAAAGALALDRTRQAASEAHGRSGDASQPADARAAMWLYAGAGGVALGYEVVWSQVIVQFTSTRAFAFAVVLATYLTGLALGSACYARRRAAESERAWTHFGVLIALAGCVSLLAVSLLGGWVVWLQSAAEWHIVDWTASRLAGMCARFAVAAMVVVLPATLLLGAAFPAAMRLVLGQDDRAGRTLGSLLAINTAGGIAGTLVTGFVLVPMLGLVRTLSLLALAATVIGLAAVVRGTNGRATARAWAIAIAAITIAIAIATPADHVARLLLTARGGTGTLAFYGESAAGTVAVVDEPGRPVPFRRLYIQGVSNSGDAMSSLRYMRLQALLPLLVHRGEPGSALVIGLGTGITTGALLPYPGLTTRVVAELMPAVVQAAPLFRGNFGVASDPRVQIRVADGRRELLRGTQTFDVITLEPPPPSAAGVVNLYSRDFYALTAARLNQHGLVAQWWPLPTQNDADSRSLVRAFLDAFPYASVWTTELHEMLLVGSRSPLELDAGRISARFAQPQVDKALVEVGVSSPAELLATWVTGREGLERYAGNAPAATDDRPTLEYATWVDPGEFPRVLEAILAQASPPPLRGASTELDADVARSRETLFTFYRGMLLAYRGDRAAAFEVLSPLRDRTAGNAYLRWVLGAR